MMKNGRNAGALILTVLCAVLLLACAAAAEQSEQSAEEQILPVLTQNGLTDPEQLRVWGGTAACFAVKDGQKALCVLEKRGENWLLTVRNPGAVRQEEELPFLTLDCDDAVYWTYLFADKVVRYHAGRGADGQWGNVDEFASFARGEVWYTYSIFWSDENGGRLERIPLVEEESGNILTRNIRPEYLPAPWLSGFMTLYDFDLDRFPSMGFAGDDDDSWPGQAYLAAAAEALAPRYTYLDGLYQAGYLHFLMEKDSGARVYVTAEIWEGDEAPVLRESSVLPWGTVLGVENLWDSIGITRGSAPQAVTVQSYRDGTSGIRLVTNIGVSDLAFGPKCMKTGDMFNPYLYGDHPWADISAIDWGSVPQSEREAEREFTSADYAVVSNPDPADRLHLRTGADKSNPSLGKYYNGTPVRVLGTSGSWARVSVGGRTGWMMKKYLTFGKKNQPLLCDTSAMPQLQSKNQYELAVFSAPDEKAPGVRYVNVFSAPAWHSMKIIGIIGNEWYHVWFPENEEYGFVRQDDLWPGNG